MPGGIMQLVAYGAEDLYLTGNPQITYFKMVYRRHTNFAMEYIEKYFYSLPNFNTTQRTQAKVKIDRDADLLYDCYLVYDLPDIRFPIEQYQNITPLDINFKWIRNPGHNIIYTTEINVGGHRIDIQYGQWLNIWTELTVTESKKSSYNRLVGNNFKLRPGFSTFYPDKGSNVTIPSTRLYIPLEFWFCKNPGLAIPLIALQYDEIYIYFEFNCLNSLFTLGPNNLSPDAFFSTPNVSNSCDGSFVKQLLANNINEKNIFNQFINCDWNQNTFLLANYIYLDDDERRKFAQSSHEYLFHQIQRRLYTGIVRGPNTVELDIFHPVKELIWVFQKNTVDDFNDWNNYTFVDLKNDYLEVKNEYNNKFDFLDHKPDSNFMTSINDFIKIIETNPPFADEPSFLANGKNNTRFLSFNDFTNIMLNATLLLNGHERFEPRDHVFFNALQSYKYHTHSAPPGVYIYSFAVYPENEQPSGTANFSRYNKAELQFNIRNDLCDEPSQDPSEEISPQGITKPTVYNLYLYAVNYNVFRIMGGMGSVAFNT